MEKKIRNSTVAARTDSKKSKKLPFVVGSGPVSYKEWRSLIKPLQKAEAVRISCKKRKELAELARENALDIIEIIRELRAGLKNLRTCNTWETVAKKLAADKSFTKSLKTLFRHTRKCGCGV